MSTQKLTNSYMYAVIAVGIVCLAYAGYTLPYSQIDVKFLFLAICTIGFGSRITVQIPKFKSHISVSDTFIFLALVLYGGEAAAILAAVEAFCSAWRFCNKKITVFFNAATMAISTLLVWNVLHVVGIDTDEELHGHTLNNFISTFSLIATVQFIANTAISSIYGAVKGNVSLWETWKTHYAWTFITYLVGSLTAGAIVFFTDYVGYSALFASIPIIVFLYLTYRMYLTNVEMSLTQAEQARNHAEVLEAQAIALAESEERFRAAFNYAPIGIALVSPNGNWLKVNKALCQILGYDEEEFLSTDFQSMIFVEDLGNTLIKIHELLSGKIPTCQLEQRYLAKDGQTVWASWSASTVIDSSGSQSNLVFQVQDITDKKIAEEQLRYKATHDGLTGLPNRSLFVSRLETAIERAKFDPLHRVCVLFIDLDRFKVVNDSLGHFVGDKLLVEIANRLRDCLRPSDMVARLGGDEFTILVEGRCEDEEVVRIAQRIHEKFQFPFSLDGHEIFSSASIGILSRNERHESAEDMMRDADTAMYQAKRAGKARHEIFNPDMHEAVKEVLQIENDLRRAIERNELFVQYQPIFALNDNTIIGFEALARWRHRELGLIEPGKFIPLAEEIGYIDVLGLHILRMASRQIRKLRELSDAARPLTLSVNLSCKQFANPRLVEVIKGILDETDFPAANLKLEITESVFFEYPEKAIAMLNQLRDLGIDISVDDFGTGYSNLNYLRRLPVSTLKIDRSFISPIDGDGNNTEIVETIAMLARSLNLKVIAEGVETEAQLAQLKRLACEGAQGNYFAPPMPFEDLAQFIDADLIPEIHPPKFEEVPLVPTLQ